MKSLVMVATLFVAPLFATDDIHHSFYGGGLDYSKLNLNGGGHLAHALPPVQQPVYASHGHPAIAPVTQVTKSVHKEVYAVKPVYEKTYEKDQGLPQVSIKFHKEPVLGYSVHPKGRSTTFVLPPLLNPKISPIITLTNKFPKDW